jgi:hypothetical protein
MDDAYGFIVHRLSSIVCYAKFRTLN